MTIALHGIGVGISTTIATGRAALLQRGTPDIAPQHVEEHLVTAEVDRLFDAVSQTRLRLAGLKTSIPASTPADIIEFIDMHLLMLADRTLSEAPAALIRDQHFTAEWALQIHRNTLVNLFDEIEDAYLSTRKDDVNHIINEIQITLLGQQPQTFASKILAGRIAVASDFTTADIIQLHNQHIAGFVSETGGPMSHTAILARSLGLPAVLGVHHTTRFIDDDDRLIIDASNNSVIVNAEAKAVAYFQARAAAETDRRYELDRLTSEPAISLDGSPVILLGNIELTEDMDATLRAGADGVGLYRTEFIYMNREDVPDEEEHFQYYSAVVEKLQGKPLTIRTLDLGADKTTGVNQRESTSHCANPALGLRGIRLCLQEPDLFLPQLRAILRAAVAGKVNIMLPMLSSLEEIISVRNIIELTRSQLKADGINCAGNISLGGMIEVPATALMADAYARELDFLSIGTNDLIQYTLAVDRVDENVNYLYDALHPAILQLVRTVIVAAATHDTPLAMCGEMASDPRYTRLLLGMGLRVFSMQPGSLLTVKHVIRNTDITQLDPLVTEILASDNAHRNHVLLEQLNADIV